MKFTSIFSLRVQNIFEYKLKDSKIAGKIFDKKGSFPLFGKLIL